MRKLIKGFTEFILTLIFSLGNTILLFFRDHNGKPSNTRLIMTIITGFVLRWGDHIVFTKHVFPLELVYALGITILGVALFMKILSPKMFSKSFDNLFMNIRSGNSGFMSTYLEEPNTPTGKAVLEEDTDE